MNLCVPFVYAQSEPPTPGARLEQLAQRLQLSQEQQDKIRPILQEEAAKLREIRAKYEGQTSRRARLKMLRELKDVQESMEKRIEPVLTKQQFQEWKKIRQARRDELREQLK